MNALAELENQNDGKLGKFEDSQPSGFAPVVDYVQTEASGKQ